MKRQNKNDPWSPKSNLHLKRERDKKKKGEM